MKKFRAKTPSVFSRQLNFNFSSIFLMQTFNGNRPSTINICKGGYNTQHRKFNYTVCQKRFKFCLKPTRETHCRCDDRASLNILSWCVMANPKSNKAMTLLISHLWQMFSNNVSKSKTTREKKTFIKRLAQGPHIEQD